MLKGVQHRVVRVVNELRERGGAAIGSNLDPKSHRVHKIADNVLQLRTQKIDVSELENRDWGYAMPRVTSRVLLHDTGEPMTTSSKSPQERARNAEKAATSTV